MQFFSARIRQSIQNMHKNMSGWAITDWHWAVMLTSVVGVSAAFLTCDILLLVSQWAGTSN